MNVVCIGCSAKGITFNGLAICDGKFLQPENEKKIL